MTTTGRKIQFKRRRRTVPPLMTATLPDLIFVVLFFFICVTHMREEPQRVQYRMPEGTQLTKLQRKASVVHIYIGRDKKGNTRLQTGGRYATIEEAAQYVADERRRMTLEDARQMTVAIKADKDTEMGVIDDLKQALRQVGALKISYSATPTTPKE